MPWNDRDRAGISMGGWMVLVTLLVASAHPTRADNTLQLQPCQLSDASGLRQVEARCGQLRVAEDPARPGGRQIDLRVAVVAASSPTAAADPLVFLAGGPGQAATEAYPNIAATLAPINQNRDILLMDQRGTGSSNALDCTQPSKPLGRQGDDELVSLTRACLAALSADPRFYTTTMAVSDLEQLRQRLGYQQFNLLGVSYGTRVAMEYARQFPARVRSMILDGVVPPPLALGSEHGRNARRVLEQLFVACRAAPGCGERLADPGESLTRLREQLADGRELSVADPRTGEPREIWLDAALLGGVIRLLAYSPESAALLPLLLSDAVSSGNPSRLAAQALMVNEQLARQISQGMELSVICSEDVPFFPEDAQDDHSLLGGALVESLLTRCETWPRGEIPRDFKEPLVSAVPTLLLSGERDPVTPPAYGEAVARDLSNSLHLLVPGQHHNVVTRGCLPEVAASFIDAGGVEGLDTRCVARIGPLPFFTSFTGPEP